MRLVVVLCLVVTAVTAVPAQDRQGAELHDLSDRMLEVEEAIRRTQTGRATQARQQRIIDRLQAMIDRLKPQPRGGAAAADAQQLAAQKSNLLPGRGAGQAPRAKKDCVEQRWIGIPPRERKRIEVELQRKLPARYKRMLEQYYKRLGR